MRSCCLSIRIARVLKYASFRVAFRLLKDNRASLLPISCLMVFTLRRGEIVDCGMFIGGLFTRTWEVPIWNRCGYAKLAFSRVFTYTSRYTQCGGFFYDVCIVYDESCVYVHYLYIYVSCVDMIEVYPVGRLDCSSKWISIFLVLRNLRAEYTYKV